MKPACFVYLLVITSNVLFSQEASWENRLIDFKVLKTDTLVAGIYLNLREFQDNNPSLRMDFRCIEGHQNVNEIYQGMPVKRLLVRNENNEFVALRTVPWGLCDGERIYINYAAKYNELSLDGKYCTFTVTSQRHSGSSYSYRATYDYVLNAVDGRISPMTSPEVEKILKWESSPFLPEFLQDRDKQIRLLIYIDRLNKSYVYTY